MLALVLFRGAATRGVRALPERLWWDGAVPETDLLVLLVLVIGLPLVVWAGVRMLRDRRDR